MTTLDRVQENPILTPNPENEWEHDGAFNGCVVYAEGLYHMVYRAFSSPKKQNGISLQVSSIGYAKSQDGINFTDHRLLISPTEDWEIYGCEDPRITYLDGKFYIFYTALSVYPFSAFGIKLAVAETKDFNTFEKHPVTTFNSKAMALFPEKINGKLVAILTKDTDQPPAKITIAEFDKEDDIYSPDYWQKWQSEVNKHIVYLLRDIHDQVELGAPPIKTEYGWLVIYSYIKNYTSNNKIFNIEAVLLDKDNPRKVLGRTQSSLIDPKEKYELEGNVKNVIFPSGALVKDGKLFVYYGAADTTCAVATCDLNNLLNDLRPNEKSQEEVNPKKFTRSSDNPIISPLPELDWQKEGAFNPAAIYEGGKVHILYRAQGSDGTSVFGYASSKDGLHIDENLDYPVYTPREDFEKKINSEKNKFGNSGCEDPRITKINDRLYMTYTAYDGQNPPRVALTTISVDDFLNKNWNWDKPKLISPPGVDDKDACIIKKVNTNGFLAFHRLGDVIWMDHLRDLDFPEKKYLSGGIIAQARKDKWDNVKVGISAPPIETEHGWLLLYHGVSEPGFMYKVGAMLLDYNDPKNIIARTDEPIFEPERPYELKGRVPNVVFPCGAVVINGIIYIYYGGADTVVGVATMPLKTLLDDILLKKS
jgi:beta-1,2-mannobiose phosphorylase / 1,2-beta-oligomannan phosphorylase